MSATRTCDDRSRSGRFGCTLPYGHLRWHAAHDLNGNIVLAWAPLAPPVDERSFIDRALEERGEDFARAAAQYVPRPALDAKARIDDAWDR